MDVTSKPSILAAVERIKAEDGKLDILVNKYTFPPESLRKYSDCLDP